MIEDKIVYTINGIGVTGYFISVWYETMTI